MLDQDGNPTTEWREFEKFMEHRDEDDGEQLNRALWNLSIILGRTFHETRDTYEHFDKTKKELNATNDLFEIVHKLAHKMECVVEKQTDVEVRFTPDLSHVILHQVYGKKWAAGIRETLQELNLENRPLHIISSNLHSVANLLYGYGAVGARFDTECVRDLYSFVRELRNRTPEVLEYAGSYGFYEVPDTSGAHVDCQIIDTARLPWEAVHPDLGIKREEVEETEW